MMKKNIRIIIAVCILFALAVPVNFTKCDEEKAGFFTDISSGEWYYNSVANLFNHDVIDPGDKFYGEAPASRKDIALYMYKLNNSLGIKADKAESVPFADVEEDEYYDAVAWAYENKIISGYQDNTFRPEAQCSREQMCVMAMRFLTYAGIKPAIKGDEGQFADSLAVSGYARSYVISAKLAGVVKGNGNAYLHPHVPVIRAELAVILNSLLDIALNPCPEGEPFVDTTDGAYTPLYDSYLTEKLFNFEAYVGEGDAVDLSYFDDAVFVGDSVSMSLQYYCASSKALGKATFLCAGSLSPQNALWDVTPDSKHPVYKGQKLKVEDAVAAAGGKKVYIMLGINSLRAGVDACIADMTTLISRISAKSPDAQIILQSVTPMTKTSPITTNKLNNDVIYTYNSKLLELAQKNGWYYINVAECVAGKDTFLKSSYCSDPQTMGIHFNFEADKVWANYLRTHAPKI